MRIRHIPRRYGFAYLNSSYCNNLHGELYGAIERALQTINDESLHRVFQSWNAAMEKREYEMISNIYRYSREHRFDRGLFFLGAAHRGTIIDKIQEYAGKEQPRLAWNYDQYESIMGNA